MSVENLPRLWKEIQQKSLQWATGKQDEVYVKENVFAVLWQYFTESNSSDELLFESEEVQEAYLRNVWIARTNGLPSQRWEYKEQQGGQHSDSLSQLSYEVASFATAAKNKYESRRVHRLRALGNAIVPAVAQVIFEAILAVEDGQ